jgi:hypothetical protein
VNSVHGLVSPVAEEFAGRPLAPRGPLANPVGLVDTMLNQTANWGDGILDAVEQQLRANHPLIRVERVRRPQLGGTPPDIWAAAMADRYAALVIAAGD